MKEFPAGLFIQVGICHLEVHGVIVLPGNLTGSHHVIEDNIEVPEFYKDAFAVHVKQSSGIVLCAETEILLDTYSYLLFAEKLVFDEFFHTKNSPLIYKMRTCDVDSYLCMIFCNGDTGYKGVTK